MSRSAHRNTPLIDTPNTGRCPRPRCRGQLVQAAVRYKRMGPIVLEMECIRCEKVVRNKRGPPTFYVHSYSNTHDRH